MGRKKKSQIAKTGKRSKEQILGIVSQAGAEISAKPVTAVQVEKDFFDILKYQRKQANNLLGGFSGEKYTLSQEVIARLLQIPKKFDRIENNILYAATMLGEFVLNFKIEMDIQPDFCKAKLFLIEIERGLEEDIKHLSLLEELTEVYMFEFRNFLCNKWHIFYEDQPFEKDDELYRFLHLQQEEFLFNRELVEILSQLYLVRMLAILDGMGQLGEKVRYEYKLMMEKFLQQNPGIAQNFTLQKQLLDFVLQKNKAFEQVLKTEDGAKVLAGFSTPLKNIRDKTYPTILETKKQEKAPEKKKEATKAKAKKKDASAKAAGGKGIDFWKNYKPTIVSGGGGGPVKLAQPKVVAKIELPKAQNPKEIASAKPKESLSEDVSQDAFDVYEQTEQDQRVEDSQKETLAIINEDVVEENKEVENETRVEDSQKLKEDVSAYEGKAPSSNFRSI